MHRFGHSMEEREEGREDRRTKRRRTRSGRTSNETTSMAVAEKQRAGQVMPLVVGLMFKCLNDLN